MSLRKFLRVFIGFISIVSIIISATAYSQSKTELLLKAGVAYMQAQSAKTVDEEIRIDIRYSAGKNATSEDKTLEEFFKKMYIKSRVIADVEKNEINMSLRLYYNNKQILYGTIYTNKEIAAYNFPQIYPKPLYVKLDQTYNGISLQVDPQKYAKLFDLKTNKDLQKVVAGYTEIVMPKLLNAVKSSDKKAEIVLSNGKKVNCSEIIFEFNKNSGLDLLKSILTKAANDVNTKDFIIQVLKAILEDSKGSLQALMLAESPEGEPPELNVDEILKQVDQNYTQAVSSAVYVLDEIKPQIPPFTIQYRIMIDDKNNFKGDRFYFYLKDSNDFKVMCDIKSAVNSLNAKITVPKIDISKAADLTKLTDKDFEMMQKNVENIFKKLGLPSQKLKM